MRTLADFDQLRSGMALQAITPEFTFGDCFEASWAALEALIEFDDGWAQHLVRVVGELHHPTAMEAKAVRQKATATHPKQLRVITRS
jgi:hypothetical protein